jgi:cobalamin biosynthesis protein CbiG
MNQQKKINCLKFWVGIGCNRGVSQNLLETAIKEVFKNHKLEIKNITGIATIDTKANESSILQLCQKNKWQLKTFSSEQLKNIPVPNPSAIAETAVGTKSICEAAAILATIKPNQILHPQNQNFAATTLTIQKQKYRHPTETGTVTIAIAETS